MFFPALSRAMRSSLPRVAAAAATLASGFASLSPTCTGNSEMRAFVKTAGGTDGQYDDLHAIGLGSPLNVLSYNAVGPSRRTHLARLTSQRC